MTNHILRLAENFIHPVSTQQSRMYGEAPDAYRWNSEAIASPLAVLLFHKGLQLGRGRIIGIGPHGLCIATEVETDEKYHLQVRFTLIENGQDVQYGLFGRVVHRNSTEIGLLMDVLDPDTRDGLQSLLEFCQQPTMAVATH